jgi:hypothetical protein
MQHLRAVFVTCVAISITLTLAASASRNKFVFVQQADSPGNDYSRIANFSFEQCARTCDADTACNAFTYNQIHRECYLKSDTGQWTTIYLGAITGIKISPSASEVDQSPEQHEQQGSAPPPVVPTPSKEPEAQHVPVQPQSPPPAITSKEPADQGKTQQGQNQPEASDTQQAQEPATHLRDPTLMMLWRQS